VVDSPFHEACWPTHYEWDPALTNGRLTFLSLFSSFFGFSLPRTRQTDCPGILLHTLGIIDSVEFHCMIVSGFAAFERSSFAFQNLEVTDSSAMAIDLLNGRCISVSHRSLGRMAGMPSPVEMTSRPWKLIRTQTQFMMDLYTLTLTTIIQPPRDAMEMRESLFSYSPALPPSIL